MIEADDDDDDVDVDSVSSGVRRLNLRNAAAARSALEKLMLGDFVGAASFARLSRGVGALRADHAAG